MVTVFREVRNGERDLGTRRRDEVVEDACRHAPLVPGQLAHCLIEMRLHDALGAAQPLQGGDAKHG